MDGTMTDLPCNRLDDHLRESARQHPDAVAYTYMSHTRTYAELERDVTDVSAFLYAQGLRAGDGIALIIPNSDAFLTLYHGALRLGMYCVPMNPLYTPDELLYMIRDSEVKAIAAPMQLTALADMVKTAAPLLQTLIAVGADGQSLPHGVTAYEGVLSEGARSGRPPSDSSRVLSVDDTAVILYTSGTTGKPKGAMLTHRNLCSNAVITGDYLGFSAADIVLTVLPMFHVFCLTVCVNASIYKAAHLYIAPRFSPAETLRMLQEAGITVFAGVPTMYNFMLQVAAGDSSITLSGLRLCVSGGSAMPVAVLEAFEQKFKTRIMEGYGLSEASPVTAFAPVDGRPRKVGSIGVTLPYMEQCVVDDQDRPVGIGEVGELVVRGPNVMKGYKGRPEDTEAALRNGWLHTGDLARMDEDGYFYIVDRKKDMILVGGYNVYPREVEETLFHCAGVVEAAVIGVPDPDYGEAVVACVVARDESVTEQGILDECKMHLAKYKWPTRIALIEQLPKNATGKVLRRVLREQMAQGAYWPQR